MIVDRVDDNDNVIGTVRIDRIFDRKANFRTVHVFAIDGDRILLQKIASNRRHGGRYGSSVAGHVFAGETYYDAAVRKVREELGLDEKNLLLEGTVVMDDNGCKKFVSLYILNTRPDTDFLVDKGQADAIEFFDISKLRRAVIDNPDYFAPTFLKLFDFYTPMIR